MKVIRDDLWLCNDCLFIAVNDDASGLDDQVPGRAEKREKHVRAALAKLGPHLVPAFDSEEGKGIEEFSWRACDCCDSTLGGSRHEFAILGEEGETPKLIPKGDCDGCESTLYHVDEVLCPKCKLNPRLNG